MHEGGDDARVEHNATGSVDPLRITDIDRLISFLHERDEPCPLCEYNLRNLTSPRCPECGHLLKLAVMQAEPYLRAWICLLIAICAGASMGIFWILLIITQGVPRLQGTFWMGMAIQVALILCMIPAIKMRRGFLRLEWKSQWRIAGAGILISFIGMVLVVSGVR